MACSKRATPDFTDLRSVLARGPLTLLWRKENM